MRPIVLNQGDKFGCLTFTGNTKNIDHRWFGEFSCECGNITFIRMDRVKCGNTKSCGCKSPNRGYKERQKTMGENYPYHVLLKCFCTRAKQRGIEFNISVDDLKRQLAKQGGRCAYTGVSITMPQNFLHLTDPNIASIDRIDCNYGYVVENIQLTTKTINFMKQMLSHDEFVSTCRMVVENVP